MSPPNADPYKRRTSKACEHCRIKRTRCSGQSPCDACISLGLGAECYVREKARPRRAPAASKRRRKSTSRDTHFGDGHVHFVRDVELAIDTWLESAGHTSRVSLPDPPRLSSLKGTPLPTDPRLLAPLEDRLVGAYRAVQHFDFLPAARVEDLYARHRHGSGDTGGGANGAGAGPSGSGGGASLLGTAGPGQQSQGRARPLASDERALVAAVLCLGRLSELCFEPAAGHSNMRPVPSRESREDVTYFGFALAHLEQWGAASCTALCALHCLHLFAQVCGGPEDTREILAAMGWHARELGLHRRDAAAAYSPVDRVGQLFFSTLYKDTWFATLVDAPPFLRWGEYEYDAEMSTDAPHTQGVLSRLALLENELLTTIHSGKVDTLTPEFVLATETRWWPLMRECGNERADRMLALVHPYADIRFNWIRLLLRAPCLSHPTLAASSTPIVARSLSRILQTYASLAAANLFHPCYAQLRRIVTCGQLLVLCHTACELGRREAEELFGVFLALVREHVGMFEYVTELITSFEAVGAFLGLAMPPVRTAAAAGDAVGAAAGTPGMRGLLPVAFEPFAIHPYSAAPSPGFGFGSLGYDPWRSLGFLGLGEIGMNGC